MSADADTVVFLIMLLVAIGAAGGFLSGLLGVGGGFLFVPSIDYALRHLGYNPEYAMHLAIGTSLAIMVANGAASSRQHKKRGGIDLELLKDWGPYVVLGVVLGSGVASSLKSQTLSALFSVITLLMALYMGFSKDDFARAQRSEKRTETAHPFFFFGVGLLSSLVGIGGAIMTVPYMTWSGIPITRAIGTAAGLGLLISLPGTLAYAVMGSHTQGLPPFSIGFISLPILLLIAPAAVLLSPLGVKIAHNINKDLLRRIFAGLLLLISAKMLHGLYHAGFFGNDPTS